MRRTADSDFPLVNPRLTPRGAIARGFSLIELLVAVFVIVLLTGVVSLNVGRGGADLGLEGEVRHLSGLLAFASAEAGLSAADHGLFIGLNSDDGEPRYQGIWMRRFDQGWAAPRGSAEVFAALDLGEGYELRLSLEGQPDLEFMLYEPELKPLPQIVAWAGGEMTPGYLEWLDVRTGDLLYRLEWDLLGRMRLLPRGVADDEN